MAKKKEEEKKKKTGLYIGIIILILIIAFLLWWFLRTFDVTFKYNNGEEDKIVKVRYLNIIKEEDVKQGLERAGYAYLGYFETYELSDEEVGKITKDPKEEENICRDYFELSSDKRKCIAEEKFNFPNTKITKDTTIEALWAAPAANPTASLTSSSKCVIGSTGSVTVTAKLSGGAKIKDWSIPSCYTVQNVSNTQKKLTRNGNCPNNAISSDTVKITLDNGKTATYTLSYEPTLDVKAYFIYGSTPNTPISPYNGKYEANKITSNIKATFTVNPSSKIVSSTDTSVVLNTNTEITTTIKTACGQSKTITTAAVIN